MSNLSPVTWFSPPQETIEAAQALLDHDFDLFAAAVVFKRPDSRYSLAYTNDLSGEPPRLTAREVWRLIGYELVSWCDPLLRIWKPYIPEEAADVPPAHLS